MNGRNSSGLLKIFGGYGPRVGISDLINQTTNRTRSPKHSRGVHRDYTSSQTLCDLTSYTDWKVLLETCDPCFRLPVTCTRIDFWLNIYNLVDKSPDGATNTCTVQILNEHGYKSVVFITEVTSCQTLNTVHLWSVPLVSLLAPVSCRLSTYCSPLYLGLRTLFFCPRPPSTLYRLLNFNFIHTRIGSHT